MRTLVKKFPNHLDLGEIAFETGYALGAKKFIFSNAKSKKSPVSFSANSDIDWSKKERQAIV